MPSLASVRSFNASKSLQGKSCIVVGGTSGIGRGIALRLAQADASVTIIGRNKEAGNQIVQEMTNVASSQTPKPKFDFIQCDAQTLGNVKSCSEKCLQDNNRLDMLVLTQGIASVNGYTPTPDGIERKLAIHYYSRVAFIKCLLPLMESSSDTPQVMSVLSAGVHSPYPHFDVDPDLERNFSIKNAADAAGLYNDVAMDSLSREHSKVTFIHTCPGAVQTAWGSEFPWYLKAPLRVLQSFFRSVEDCAEFHAHTLMRPEYQAGGFHLVDQNAEKTKVTSMHEPALEPVWKHTKEVLAKYGIE